jgi:DNA invertase Pin-like site-specific DNA recombinase
MIHILAAFAEHERALISERTKAALAAAKARGVELGRNGKVLAVQNQLAARAFALSLSNAVEEANAAGAKTLLQIAGRLNDEGFRTREGRRWTPGTLHRLLWRLNQTAGMQN